MALPLYLTYSVQDESGDVATTSVKIPSGFSLAQYTEFGAAFATLVNNVILGKITGAELVLDVDIAALALNLLGGASDVEEIGAFRFDTAEGRRVVVNIPGLDEDTVTPGTDNLNQSNAGILAFIQAMTSAGITTTGGTIYPCDIGEDDIVTTVSATERARASGSYKG